MHFIPAIWMVVLLLFGFEVRASAGDFYHQFLSLVDTNQVPWPFPALLVDTDNTGIKVANAVGDLAKLKESGEISGVGLGMTMQTVVDRWGKPRGGWSRCLHGLITFFYNGVSLGFEGDRLVTIHLHYPPTTLASGLSSESPMHDFVQVPGTPTGRRIEGNSCNLAYLSTNASIRLVFHEQKLMSIYLERTLTRAEPWKLDAQDGKDRASAPR